MRLLTILTIVFFGIIGLGIGVNNALATNAEKLTANFDYIEQAIKQGNWPMAIEQINEVEKSWSKSKNWWAVVIDHQEIDNIEFTFSRIKSFMEAQNISLSLGELAVLKKSIKHIPEKEAVNIRNIL